MTIEAIFSRINADKGIQLGEDSHESLAVFPESSDIFYVPTIYDEIISNINSKFIIFSAPGASGKSALAKYIAKKYKGIYWNLADIKIGENTFYGTLWRTLRQDVLIEYCHRLENGKSVLVLDAFDEAEMISGRTGIEIFLNDLSMAVANSEYPSIILLARTETASFLAEYCKEQAITFSQYEIGFFTEKNARTFIEKSYLNRSINGKKNSVITPAITSAIEAIFAKIKNVLIDPDLYNSFIGYAPILQAIERTIEEEKNTAKLLSNISNKEGVSEHLIFKILGELLEREHDKVVNALQQKWAKKNIENVKWDLVYSSNEQVVRIIEYILEGSITKESLYEMDRDIIPDDYVDDYLELMLPFMEQHPFIQNFALGDNIDFTGPAFRDYAIACALCSEYDFLAKEFLADKSIASHYPSQLLFDFYKLLSGSYIKDDLFSVLYESFKAKEKNGCRANVSLIGGMDDLTVAFSLLNGKSTEVDNTIYFSYKDKIEILSIDRISDGYIDFDGIVEVKGKSNGSRIADSSIIADKLILNTDRIELGVSPNRQLILSSKHDVVSNQNVSFEIRKSDNSSIKIDFPNIKYFYKLINYGGMVDEVADKRFTEFRRFFVKVLNSMRAHSKDMPAKDKEKIDFVYIGNNSFKKAEMEFLISKGIFFVDKNPAQSHLYKLRTDELAKYDINWVMINQGKYGSMQSLFDEFILENPNITLL